VLGLTRLNRLVHLNLSPAQVTDDVLRALRAGGLLHALAQNRDEGPVLDLSGARVTDVGLKELVPYPDLATLCIGNTGVTDTGARELQKALPQCIILR
jgi:hypothetical protein